MNLGSMSTDLGYYLNDPSLIRYTEPIRTRFCNVAYVEYYNELVRVGYQGLLATPALLDVTANTETVTLPTDFFIMHKLSKVMSSYRKPLQYSTNLESGVYTGGVATGDNWLPEYAMRGTSLVLQPMPSATESDVLYCEYFPVATAMTTAGTSPASGFSEQFHPLIPLKAAILIKGTKEDEDISTLSALLNKMEQPFRSLIQSLTKQRKKTTRFII